MKLFNFKKTISYSTAFLTIFSSINTLNCVKVAAAPIVEEPQTKIVVKDNILFTFGDMKNLVTHLESILKSYAKSNKLTSEPSLQNYPVSVMFMFDEFLENTATTKIPNFSNLIRINEDKSDWFESIRIYLKVIQKIFEEDLDENVKKEIKKICNNDTLNVGNMLNDIRKIMTDRNIHQNVKETKYLITIIDFLKTAKLGSSKRTSAQKIKRFTNARKNLMQILESTYELDVMDEAIEDIEKTIENAIDPEVKTMAEIILNIIKGRKNLALTKISVNTANKEKYLKALKDQNAATQTLVEALEKIYAVEKMPTKILIGELEELV